MADYDVRWCQGEKRRDRNNRLLDDMGRAIKGHVGIEKHPSPQHGEK